MYRLCVLLLVLLAAPAAAQQPPPSVSFTQADIEALAKVYQASPELRAKTECATGNASACTAYGQALMAGTMDTQKDQPLAVRNFSRACDLGHAPGCNFLGVALQGGRGAAVDLPGARAAFAKSCLAGFNFGCMAAGRMLLRGQGGAADVDMGLSLLNQACDNKVGQACTALGSHYAGTGAAPTDPSKAGGYFGRACAMGERIACNERDRMALFSGPPAPKINAAEVAAASALHASRPDLKAQAGCAAKIGSACTDFGLMQMNGAASVTQDPAGAVASFGQACTLGNGPGCRALGMALQGGRGAAIDLPRARASYLAACAAKDGAGCGRAGGMFASGQGGARDLVQGLGLLTQGCDLSEATACNGLGQHYASNAPVDLVKAAMFFVKACDLGNACAFH